MSKSRKTVENQNNKKKLSDFVQKVDQKKIIKAAIQNGHGGPYTINEK